MSTYKYLELTSCVKNELIEIKFTGVDKMNVAVISEDSYNNYKEDISSVKRHVCSSPAYFRASGLEKVYVVLDLDGKDVNKIDGSVRRFSPDLTSAEVQKLPPMGKIYVMNAHDTVTKDSMIQHWKDNQSENSKINLNNKTFHCPSCGKTVSVDILNGAHVNRLNDPKGTLYITPTCESCNKSKVDRIFMVDWVDLILPPKD